MNTRIRSLSVILIVLALSLAAVGPLSAGATKAYFTATEFDEVPLNLGEEFYPDGRYHLREAVSQFTFMSSDPRLNNAEDVVTINWNFEWMPEPVFVSGRMWGRFVLTNAGGYWEGTWTGFRDTNGFSYFHFAGAGGGAYEGMQLRMWGERLDPDPTVPEIYQGYILEHGN